MVLRCFEACVRGWAHRLGPLTRASRLDGAASGVLPLGISTGGDWLNFQRLRLNESHHFTLFLDDFRHGTDVWRCFKPLSSPLEYVAHYDVG